MFSAAALHVLAMGVLAGLAIGAGIWLVVFFRRFPLTPVQTTLYFANVAVTHLLWRVSVSGPLPICSESGAVIVCNHRSSIDPCFVEVTTRRVVHWMVAKEFWSIPILGWFFRVTESIPVSRGGIDTAATKAAIRYLERGGLVGIFPEGRINTTERLLLPGRPGAALIALKARTPIIPCYIGGSPFSGTIWSPFFTPARVRIEVGRPIDLSPYYGREREREVLELVTKRLLSEIAALAGQPDYQPEVAGRLHRSPPEP